MKSFRIGDLTIPVPVDQGGMGIGISLSGLASAVAREGDIGTIAAIGTGLIPGTPDKSYRQDNIEGLIGEIRKARQLTTGVLAVNIISVLSNFSNLVQTSIKEKIDIIFSGAIGFHIKSITTVKEAFERLKNEFYSSLNLTVNNNETTQDIQTNYTSRR